MMIKFYKDQINKNINNSTQIEIRKNKYRADYQMWSRHIDFFPEKMYFVFKEYLQKNYGDTEDAVCFFDVGAAEGLYTITAAQCLKNSTIVSFEPEHERCAVLVENLEQNKKLANFHVHQKMVSNKNTDSEQLKIWNYKEIDAISAGSATPVINAEQDIVSNRIGTNVFHIATTLDQFIDSYNKVDIIKIDVEGGEIKVFEGATKLIEKHKPTIFLELHNSQKFNFCTIDKVKKALGFIADSYNFKLIDSHDAKSFFITAAGVEYVGSLEYYIMTPIKE